MSSLALARDATTAARAYASAVRAAVRAKVAPAEAIEPALLNTHQRATHGYAWTETIVTSLEAMLGWAQALEARASFGEAEALTLSILFGEYLAQLIGGLPMSANELVRPGQVWSETAATELAAHASVQALMVAGAAPAARARLIEIVRSGGSVSEANEDELINAIRDQFRRYTADRILPNAHRWHLEDALIPATLIQELADLGTFGVTIAAEHGGLGLGKLAMCVITEELSRGWIGTGSLGTRSEIAGELIGTGATLEQQQYWLPRIASGEILPTAVFTEPGSGSDLASLATRAVRQPSGSWRISGTKTWITHAARSDLMTVLARTGEVGHGGISLFLVPKPRGSESDPFPMDGMRGGEIAVLGYRGMREYELAFDGLESPSGSLLGEVEGQGFRQLMRTFESARIQTAARAIGVAWRAYDLGLGYALERRQFGSPLIEFPRVSDKLAMMIAETVGARELTYFAAREKDAGKRCDVEAGMAKLLAARVAWANADNSLQIHGGNGYALESEISRILCDARILNIFEGAAEIQAQVIARRLLET